MRALGWLLLPLTVCSAAFAQAGGSAKQIGTSTVTGHVYCSDTNGPARLAQVVLEPAESIDGYTPGAAKGISAHMSGVQTLPDGSFAVPKVAPGTYYVFASLPGYMSPLSAIAATSDELRKPTKALKEAMERTVPRVTVQANLPAAIDVTLQRGAAVNGTVLYDDGSPAAGLQVQLLVHQKDKWVEPRDNPMQGTPSATTDDRGSYRISSLAAREYLLEVKLSLQNTHYDISDGGFGMSTEASYTVPVYSGGALRSKTATPFLLKPGEERPGEDIEIPLSKLHTVSGSISAAADGHTVNAGTVSLLYADDRTEAASTTLGSGDTGWTLRFVPEGDYILRVTDASDVQYEEIANPPGYTPPTHTIPHKEHTYGSSEQPLHVAGEMAGVAVSVPEPGAAATAGDR